MKTLLNVTGKYRYTVCSLRNWGDGWQLESSADGRYDAERLYETTKSWDVHRSVGLVDTLESKVLYVHESTREGKY